MSKPNLVSGIQPTGKLHIGNYLGAVKNFIQLQDDYNCYYFIATYHSLTAGHDPKTKKDLIFNVALDYLAAGINPAKAVLFNQVDVPECTELAWIFNCLTPIAELERMTQFKDKSAKNIKSINMGLLDYPVLQAADILIYRAEKVPVGEDQVQHVELTRKVARWFNNTYGQYFKQPEPILTKAKRIMSIIDPTKKMSKSYGDNHCIYLTDEPDVILNKIKKAPTGTGTEGSPTPGAANLLMLLEEFGADKEAATFKNDIKNKTIKYSELKATLAEIISNYFVDFRKKRKELEKDPDYVWNILKQGAEKARPIAEQTMREVKEKIGIL